MAKQKQTIKPKPKYEIKPEYMKLVAGKVPESVKTELKNARDRRGWNESQFVRYAIEKALREEPAAA